MIPHTIKQTHEVEIEINTNELLAELSTDDIIKYLERDRFIWDISRINQYSEETYIKLMSDYFHKDFDIIKLIKKIGIQTIKEEINKS